MYSKILPNAHTLPDNINFIRLGEEEETMKLLCNAFNQIDIIQMMKIRNWSFSVTKITYSGNQGGQLEDKWTHQNFVD